MRSILLLAVAVSTLCAQTTVKFSADSGEAANAAFAVGPFPTDALTQTDRTQLTGVRVTLPPISEGSCTAESSPVCSNNDLLNQLDGFSVNPRLMVCFSAPVDASSLGAGISLVPINGRGPRAHGATVVPINQIIVDPKTNCAFAKPDQVLDQQTEYLLVVTDSVLDSGEKSVAADPAFSDCIGEEDSTYCEELSDALKHSHPNPKGKVVAASVFTTMSATTWLEGARRFVDGTTPLVSPAGFPWIFPLSSLQSITWNPALSGLPPQDIPIGALQGVGSIAFGVFFSPNYLNPGGPTAGTITASPTNPNASAPVSFHVFLPTPSVRTSPHGNQAKIPVVIYGHGLGDSQFGAPTYIASTFAQHGFATLAFEVTGHGFGQTSFVTVTPKIGVPSNEFTPGRGIQLSPASIGATDGCIVPGAYGIRDCARQTAVDLFTLVHAIQATNGLGLNLDPQRVYYVGQSLGSIVGTLFMAVEPTVSAAVLNGAGGTSVDIARLAITGRPLGIEYLSSLNDPALLNVAAGLAPPEAYFYDPFNDDYPFRNNPPIVNTSVGGAMADQAAFEAADWIGMVGDPLAFAPHLNGAPLAGVPAKNVLFQFAFGDLEVPNPTESAVVRAANGQTSTSFFQFQVAVGEQPELAAVTDPAFGALPILPHRVLSNPTIFWSANPTPGQVAERSIAIAEQRQAVDYFSSGGTGISDANSYLTPPFSPKDGLFVNAPTSLPESLNFVQFNP